MKTTIIVATALILGNFTAVAADYGRHPHLHQAFEAIEHAKKQLEEANDHKKTEFGGHREKAVELLKQAQREIEAAAQYANSRRR